MSNYYHMPASWQVFFVIICLLLSAKLYKVVESWLASSCFTAKIKEVASDVQLSASLGEKTLRGLISPPLSEHTGSSHDLPFYKAIYHKLHNLEQYSEVISDSRDLLLSLFTETLVDARNSAESGILSVKEYTSDSLSSFLKSEDDRTNSEWEQYIARRRAGMPREMFQDKKEAKWWLNQVAPVKYVDGAWLGHINKIATPYALRRATKDAWQVMSEELGDGDIRMNHAFVYDQLMKDIKSGLPSADNVDFTSPRQHLNEECVWKSAVAQLLISLFPHEFLPEILGFNMHFEALTVETMKAAKELDELGLNSYYFVLHVSIDNADSGHTAIAMQAVIKYLAIVRQTQGKDAEQQAWRRVQAGYIMSKGLSSAPECPSRRKPTTKDFPRNDREASVLKIFKAKTPVAHKIHCSSRIRMGGRKFSDWLEPIAFADKQWQMDFIDHLSNLRPWVRRGDSDNSKLIHELSWGGKMFGSFTHNEVEVVKRWIDGLAKINPKQVEDYWTITGRKEIPLARALQDHDIRTGNPVLSPISRDALHQLLMPTNSVLRAPSKPNPSSPPVFLPMDRQQNTTPDLPTLLPLWFTSPTLLESTICIPAKTLTPLHCNIIRLLRAQSGFDAELPCVAGMDEARRTDSLGIVELGLEMVRRNGLSEPADLKDVLETWPSEFAVRMLEVSGRPVEAMGLLVGMSWAFLALHEQVAGMEGMLGEKSRSVLGEIVRREKVCLEACFEEIKKDEVLLNGFHRGFEIAKEEIQKCFH